MEGIDLAWQGQEHGMTTEIATLLTALAAAPAVH